MVSAAFSRIRRKVWLVWVGLSVYASLAFGDAVEAQTDISPSPTAVPRISESLKGKTNEELVHLLIGGKSVRKLEAQARRANEVTTHLPAHFWEMPPKDAALALVQDNCNLKKKTQLKISIRDDKGKPPDRGSVQLRLEGASYNIPRESLLNLSSDGMNSTLSFSEVELRGPVKRAVVERAVRRTTLCALPGEEARRLYEVIWWLGRTQFAWPKREADADEATTERIVSSHSVQGKLSVQPDGLRKHEITLCPAPLSECYYETFDDNLYASFIWFLFRETLNRHGVDSQEPTAVLGEETFSSAEEKFVYTMKPPPPTDPAAGKWIERMLKDIGKYPSSVISDLASIDEPLRYADPRIDDALFRVLCGGLSPHALDRKTYGRGFTDSADAARALAGRKRADAFPIIMQLLEVRNEYVGGAKNELLQAATLLASTKPEHRQELIEYLTTQLNDPANSPHYTSTLFDSVWRGDFRELTPFLEKMATVSQDEIEDEYGASPITPPQPIVGRFHGARRVLTAWREPDALTKLKLDAIIEASSFHLGGPAEFLLQEFDALPAEQQQKFQAFVGWLETQTPEDSSWYLERLKRSFRGR